MSTPTNPIYPPQNYWMLPQPISATQVVTRTIELIRKNFKLWMGIGIWPILVCFALLLPVAGFMFFMLYQQDHDGSFLRPDQIAWNGLIGGFLLLFVVAWIVGIVVMAHIQASATWAALRLDAGAEATAQQARQVGWQMLGRSTWLMVLHYLVTSGPFLLGFLLIFGMSMGLATAGNDDARAGIAVVGMLFFMLLIGAGAVYFIFAFIWTSLSYPACVTENLPAWQSIQRSVQLTRGARGRIFLTGLLLYLVLMAAVMGLEFVGIVVVMIGAGVITLLHESVVAIVIAAIIGGLILVPLLLVFQTLAIVTIPIFQSIYYRDQRRLEPGNVAVTHPGTGNTGQQFQQAAE